MPFLVENTKFYTVAEIAQAMRVTPQTVREYIKRGRIKAQRIGRPLVISEQALRAFLQEATQPQG